MDEQTHGLLGGIIATLKGIVVNHPQFGGMFQLIRNLEAQHKAAAPPAPEPPPEVTPPQPDHSGDEQIHE